MSNLPETYVLCGNVQASCSCIRPIKHDGYCGCDCGGSYLLDDAGELIGIGSFPNLLAQKGSYTAEDFDDD